MLSPEDQERMIARLGGEEPEQEAPVVEAAPVEAVVEEEVAEAEAPVEAAEVDDEEEATGGHAVPYDRFRQVNERRKTLQSEIADRDRRLEELQAQLNQKYQQAEQPQEESHGYNYEEYEEEADPDSWAARFKQVEAANKDMQIKLAHMDIQKEIIEASKEYPGVPEAYMWDMIAQDGNITAQEAAQQYSSFVGEVEEAAIARYLEAQKGEVAHGAPPRPLSKQTVGTEHLAEPQSPRSLDEARQAMVMYLNS